MLTWSGQQGSEDINTPTPMELQFDLQCSPRQEDIKISTPMELQVDLECSPGQKDIKIPTPMELQVNLEWSTRIRRYQNSHPHGTSC